MEFLPLRQDLGSSSQGGQRSAILPGSANSQRQVPTLCLSNWYPSPPAERYVIPCINFSHTIELSEVARLATCIEYIFWLYDLTTVSSCFVDNARTLWTSHVLESITPRARENPTRKMKFRAFQKKKKYTENNDTVRTVALLIYFSGYFFLPEWIYVVTL